MIDGTAQPTRERPPTPMTLPLFLSGTVNPGAETTLVSQRLTFAYEIQHLTISFPTGADHLVRVFPMLCQDPSVSTVGAPPGNRILSFCSPDGSVRGDDARLEFPMNLLVPQHGTWLKCHLENADVFVHRISAILSLREVMEV